MISEGSCGTKDWSNGHWKFSFAVTGTNYILKYVNIIALHYVFFIFLLNILRTILLDNIL